MPSHILDGEQRIEEQRERLEYFARAYSAASQIAAMPIGAIMHKV
jgi:hypothetical protein